jgi:hypothetical protein
VKSKIESASELNTKLILNEMNQVELLLDLLEHEDVLVGVMASEILTKMHAVASDELEQTIQDCPAGLTKLLNRMPDRSREEVSNQAIILIQQLTASNEEMKKTVAFNEVSFLSLVHTFSFICPPLQPFSFLPLPLHSALPSPFPSRCPPLPCPGLIGFRNHLWDHPS